MPTDNKSQFAEAARAKKVAAYVAHFDRWLREVGLDPHADAAQLAETIGRMKRAIWVQHSIVCDQRVPSETTIAAIVAVYRERADAASVPQAEDMGEDPFARFAS